ncbi:hypothetical protein GCM10009560_03530 [Nonomuraea longicatena]|uniref:HIT domain-containing protein n=2 Tax=Nonomuraea longicatena TaxID=83682 RepID=A0ABP3Z0V1_9ACTN
MAFLDRSPAAPGHTLVVPRVHARDIWELSEDEHARVARTAHRVARLLKAALQPEGLSIRHASGAAAGQDVFHFHLHVIPRRRGDAIGPGWEAARADDRELVEVRARILAHLPELR